MAAFGAALARDPVRPARPLTGPGRWLRVAPFLGIAAVGWLLALVVPGYDVPAVLTAGAVLVAITIAVGVLPWSRWPAGWHAVPAMALYPVAVLLQYAAGERAQFIFLTALPVIWLALFHTRRMLVLGLAVLALTLFGPPLLPVVQYPADVWQSAGMAFILSCFGGLAGHHVMSRSRVAAAEAAAAERQAKAEHDLLNAYLDTASCLLLALDREGRITLFNRFAEQVTGYRAADVIGHTLWQAGAEPDAGKAAFDQVLAGSWPVHYEGDTITATGERRRIAWRGTALVDEAGQVVHVVSTGMDVTELRDAQRMWAQALWRERQASERLRELDRIKGDFVAMVSHDLRTPLTSIVGNTELLLDGDAGELGPMQRRLLEAVDRNARRLDSLVGDLLLLSRIESGTLHIQRRPVSLQEVLAGAMEALAAQRAADVKLEVDLPAEPALVCGDPDQLERVTTNLVSNAFKFTPPTGRVGIGLRLDPGQVQLTVTDTGVGIPAEELPHVFDRFYRSSRSDNGNRHGTGLGLTIAKSIVEQHEGTIQAWANPEGGTVFTVTLPRLSEQECT